MTYSLVSITVGSFRHFNGNSFGERTESANFLTPMRGYPINSFLLWEVPDSGREDLEVYRFIDSASDAGQRNKRVQAYRADNIAFVLDGQQRLTSLLIGFKGTYESKKLRQKTVDQRLYLDLLRKGQKAGDGEEVSYGFEFRQNGFYTTGSEWFLVANIRKHQADLEELIEEVTEKLRALRAEKDEIQTAQQNLRRLHEVYFSDASICYHVEAHADQSRMLDIFVRANSGGKQLSKPDLLLSNLTVHWTKLDAREEIKIFVGDLNCILNRGMVKSKPALTQDFVLKSCLVLAERPVAYDISSFSKQNCRYIEECWPDIRQALTDTVEAARWFGINGLTLTSVNALIPIAVYLYKNSDVHVKGDSKGDAENASRIRRWLIMALLNRMFSGSSDSMLNAARSPARSARQSGGFFPVAELDSAAQDSRRLPTRDPKAIKRILELQYKNSSTFLALTLLYDERAWPTAKPDSDHIFPQVQFKQEPKECQASANSLGNLMLLDPQENRKKGAEKFETWIRTREPAFLKRHLIPIDERLWQVECFPEFLRERSRLVLDRLFGVLDADSMGV